MSTMSKRKISCLTCRSKKIKCDGNKPCKRCSLKEIDCVYTKPGQAGRPPKNAVVNKFVLARPSKQFCREFIFENITTSSLYLKDSKSIGLGYYLTCIYNTFTETITGNDQQLVKKRVKQIENTRTDLTHYFTWMSAGISEILVERLSKLRLTHYICTEFLSFMVKIDPSDEFFDGASTTLVYKNPLNAIPPDQAIRIIDCFFYIHPYSIIVNKTTLLQAYWTDKADPLLLSVIYGTTMFMSNIMDGQPLNIWDTNNFSKRNPFLEYAHVLLSKASAEVTICRFQAVVLLAVFEVTFGFAKKGISLFGLSYMIAEKLGILNDKLPEGTSAIEKEIITATFWSVVQCTARGCIELVSIPRKALYNNQYVLPPVNASSSLSYQFDIQSGNLRSFKHINYIIETFYVQCVIAKFTCKIVCVLQHDTVENDINSILDEFYEFIQNEKQKISELQLFTLELSCSFYKICLCFLRKTKNGVHLRPGIRLPKDLDLTNPEIVERICRVVPEAVNIIDKILYFIHTHPDYSPEYFPRPIMVPVIDICLKLMIYYHTIQPLPYNIQCLETIETILLQDLVWENWNAVDYLKPIVREFLNEYSTNMVMLMSLNYMDNTPIFPDNTLLQNQDLFDICTDWEFSTTDLDLAGTNFIL